MEQVELITEDNQTIVVEHFENGDEIATQDFIALLEDED